MNFSKNYWMLKRSFDIFLAYVGLVGLSAFWFIFCFAIWLEDGRPIFYLQERVGKKGKIFLAIKFRTLGYKKGDSRIARFLRASALDELPQLINILKGEMSFVGPRPLIPEELESCQDAANLRLTVPTGLTGVAQISVFKDTPVLEKLKYDLWYINNQSLWLDILLILRSFWISSTRRWDRVGLKNSILSDK